MRINRSDLEKIEALLDEGKKQEAVLSMSSLLDLYLTEAQEDKGPWEYLGTRVGTFLQETIQRVKNECPEECEASDYEILRFKLGDRVYGYNIDDSALLFALSPYFGQGNLIIDNINNQYRLKSSSISTEDQGLYQYKIWKEDRSLSMKEQQEILDSYVQFYQEVPKLASLPRYEVSEISPEGIKMINRGCKFGILKTILDGGTIHFNVDSYLHDPKFIDQAPGKTEKIDISEGFYTAKELRFAKRIYDHYPELAKNIKFYDKGKEIPPPWLIKTAEWSAYLSKGQSLKDSMLSISESKTLDPAIRENAIKAIEQSAKSVISLSEELMAQSEKQATIKF